jgi:hypothetical protein
MDHSGAACQGGEFSADCNPNLMSEQKIRLPLRIPASLKAKLAELAEREHRSLNKQIEFLLDRCIREESNGETSESPRPSKIRSNRK